MSNIEQTYHNLTDEMVNKSALRDNNPRIIEILAERANLFDELGMPDEAQGDRNAINRIRRRPHDSHFQLCCERAAHIELDVLKDRIRHHCQS